MLCSKNDLDGCIAGVGEQGKLENFIIQTSGAW
jgi:hypothetical protein